MAPPATRRPAHPDHPEAALYKRIYHLIALLLLALFFAPCIIKLQQGNLVLLLIGGRVLPAVKFFT